jgi:hypothetical protein
MHVQVREGDDAVVFTCHTLRARRHRLGRGSDAGVVSGSANNRGAFAENHHCPHGLDHHELNVRHHIVYYALARLS